VKIDAVPGRSTVLWFTPTLPGRYRIFCAEYCGMNHSGMIGYVTVMEPVAFQTWLAGGPAPTNLAEAGEKLFIDLACITCHRDDSGGRGPSLEGVFGSTVKLRGGGTVTADEAYVRESISNPMAKIVEGYQPLMPTFQGLVTEEQIIQLIAYVKSLGPKPGQPGTTATEAPAPAATTPRP
jgi:cytochrome c oxidase subunit 2